MFHGKHGEADKKASHHNRKNDRAIKGKRLSCAPVGVSRTELRVHPEFASLESAYDFENAERTDGSEKPTYSSHTSPRNGVEFLR